MAAWNQALDAATSRWSNLSVLDWASFASANDLPFSDGIHYTAVGYEIRNGWLMERLAAARR